MLTGLGISWLSSIREGTLIAVSDGSYKEAHGTASWWIETEEDCMSGDTLAPGMAQDQSSYRSELAGIYSILIIMHHMCRYYAVTEGGITIGCDGLEALKKSFIYNLDIEDPC